MNKKQLPSPEGIKSRDLKRIIGLFYFLIVVIIYWLNLNNSNKDFHRLLVCFNASFFGLGTRAYVYYGLFKEDETKSLTKEERNNCIFSYIYYAGVALAVTSFIYLVSYDNFQKMSVMTFNFISLSLFFYTGFAIDEVRRRFLAQEKKE